MVEMGMDKREYGSTSSKEQTSSEMSSPFSSDWKTRDFFDLEELFSIFASFPFNPSLAIFIQPLSIYRFKTNLIIKLMFELNIRFSVRLIKQKISVPICKIYFFIANCPFFFSIKPTAPIAPGTMISTGSIPNISGA